MGRQDAMGALPHSNAASSREACGQAPASTEAREESEDAELMREYAVAFEYVFADIFDIISMK